MSDLGKRAAACRHWRWLPGMLWCLPSHAPGPLRGRMIGGDPSALLLAEGWPDLDDPVTLIYLMALVREVWDKPTATCEWFPSRADGWMCLGCYGHTQAEALVAALEAAP